MFKHVFTCLQNYKLSYGSEIARQTYVPTRFVRLKIRIVQKIIRIYQYCLILCTLHGIRFKMSTRISNKRFLFRQIIMRRVCAVW